MIEVENSDARMSSAETYFEMDNKSSEQVLSVGQFYLGQMTPFRAYYKRLFVLLYFLNLHHISVHALKTSFQSLTCHFMT